MGGDIVVEYGHRSRLTFISDLSFFVVVTYDFADCGLGPQVVDLGQQQGSFAGRCKRTVPAC